MKNTIIWLTILIVWPIGMFFLLRKEEPRRLANNIPMVVFKPHTLVPNTGVTSIECEDKDYLPVSTYSIDYKEVLMLP